MGKAESLATARIDLVLTRPEQIMIQLLLWPKQNPAAEGQSQTAHITAQLKWRCPHAWARKPPLHRPTSVSKIL